MNKNRLAFIISAILSLVVSLPRVLFMLNENKNLDVSSIIQVSIEDILIRFILLFSFSFVTLKFNLVWIERVKLKNRHIFSVVINSIILFIWIGIFGLINAFVYAINSSVISPIINALVYFFFLVLLLLASKAITLIEKTKLDALEKEILKRHSLQNELDALKGQINPHFFFNSLNTLVLLVREDQNAAVKFINKLSFLFRYILQSQEQSLVTVDEELKVLDSYIHLIKQRYQENFNVSIHVSDQMKQRKMPVLALQILMENVLNHNEISIKRPMMVEVFEEGNWIVVKNKLQKRSENFESTGTGLRNLNTRAKIRMNKEIEISKNKEYFIVKTPTK